MSTVKEIIDAIRHLTPREREELDEFLIKFEDDAWDKQMKADAAAGKLDWVAEQAIAALKAGNVKTWP